MLKEAQRLRQVDGKFKTHLLYIQETLLQNPKLNPKTQNLWGCTLIPLIQAHWNPDIGPGFSLV